ncbi:MAG: glutamate--cysteine ligase, partial [Solirubrobacteraceae bacterium]
MGEQLTATTFSREQRQRYREKVKRCLEVFARLLAEARFDPERGQIGLEIELNLTDEYGDPAMANAQALELIANPDFQTELGQFNLEINVAPQLLRSDVFSEL